MESLRCIFTQIGIIFKHDLRLSKCQSWCSVSTCTPPPLAQAVAGSASVCACRSSARVEAGID